MALNDPNGTFERIDGPNDPLRCVGTTPHGPCPYRRVAPTDVCTNHGAGIRLKEIEKKAVRTYRLNKLEGRKNEFADDSKVKSLREDIALVRVLIEQMWNRCQNDDDLYIQSAKITDMIMKLERLVVSCNTLEMKLGMMLDRGAIMQLASSIVEIVSEYIVDSDDREAASTKILESLCQVVAVKE